MLTQEEVEKVISDIFINDYKYISPYGLYNNNVIGESKPLSTTYHHNNIFPHLILHL